jgi:hypothetical protein
VEVCARARSRVPTCSYRRCRYRRCRCHRCRYHRCRCWRGAAIAAAAAATIAAAAAIAAGGALSAAAALPDAGAARAMCSLARPVRSLTPCAVPMTVLSRLAGWRWAGAQLLGMDALYLTEDLYDVHGAQAQAVLMRISIASALGSLLVALPAGLLADTVGKIPCVVFATLTLGGVLLAMPYLPSTDAAEKFVPLNGVAQQLYGVVDFALVVLAMPDRRRLARDTGTFNAAGALGPFVISTYNGLVLAAFGGTVDPDSPSLRPTYSRAAYVAVYAPTAALVMLSSVLICCASYSIAQQRARPAPCESSRT